jgi:hypothetical protein
MREMQRRMRRVSSHGFTLATNVGRRQKDTNRTSESKRAEILGRGPRLGFSGQQKSFH